MDFTLKSKVDNGICGFHSESRGVRLKDNFSKGHGYTYLVELALQLAETPVAVEETKTPSVSKEDGLLDKSSDGASLALVQGERESVDDTSEILPPLLIRLLDIMVDLAQTGTRAPVSTLSGIGGRSGRLGSGKPVRALFEGIGSIAPTEVRERELEGRIQDIEVVQALQDVFLKTGNLTLQLEILDRLLRLFASHADNYVLAQERRTMPLFLQNMGIYPPILQERLLKVLEYAVTVVNCVPEQELLSLCYLLQQPYGSSLRKTVLFFFEKLLSFDRNYKKVFREVGILDLLLDDLRRCELPGDFALDPTAESVIVVQVEPRELHIFEDQATVTLAWDCLLNLLKKSEGNQTVFRKANGVVDILPLLTLPSQRTGVLRVLSCLIGEDQNQVHTTLFSSLRCLN